MTIAVSQGPKTLFDRFAKLNWGIITILCALAFVGVLMHFSVSSGAWTDMPQSAEICARGIGSPAWPGPP